MTTEQESHPRSQFEEVLVETTDAVVSIDAEHRVTFFNSAAERLFGYRRHEVLGRPLDMLLPEGVRRSHRRHVENFDHSPARARFMEELGLGLAIVKRMAELLQGKVAITSALGKGTTVRVSFPLSMARLG
ncbi:MAG: PAS domain-containing protein [Pseudomonadota bacterium]